MGTTATFVMLGFATLLLGLTILLYFWVLNMHRDARKVREVAEQEADAHVREILRQAREEAAHIRDGVHQELAERRRELDRREQRLDQRESAVDRRYQQLEELRQKVEGSRKQAERNEADTQAVLTEQRRELERIAQLTGEQAKQRLLAAIEKEIRLESNRLIQSIEEEARREANRRANLIVLDAIQRCAVSQVGESTVSVVPLPSDEMKGRIIGREGRNIRQFENLTGVDLIIDDTPEAVVLSAFDPKRRETARRALEMLVADGRIHPARIEEMVAKAKAEMDEQVQQAAEAAMLQVGVSGLKAELIDLLGTLKFRTSYGQNQLDHAVEVALLAGTMASQLDLPAALARRAGLLHDIGKSVDATVEGTHAQIGADILRRNRERDEVVAAAECHHDTNPRGVIAVLVQVADAISSARPGARRESLEAYIERLQQLEKIAEAFEGVEKAYAIQAGREVRVMVKPSILDDLQIRHVAKEIATKIEEEVQYPGQVKVVVIRETRALSTAR